MTSIGNVTSNIADYTCTVKIPRPKDLYILFYIDENDNSQDEGLLLFRYAARTRKNNILKRTKNSDYIVYIKPIHSFNQIKSFISECIEANGGKGKSSVKEIGIFSHCGIDGPIIVSGVSLEQEYKLPSDDGIYQMNLNGWNDICKEWSIDAKCVFYGCNSANPQNSFAQKLSSQPNFTNVEVIGQSNFSYPSILPDKRVIPIGQGWLDINWNDDPCYMVAGRKGRAVRNTKLIPLDSDKAEPMMFYKNGNLIYSGDQGVFNDHRI